MGKEIERKFLLKNDGWRGLGESLRLRQGYLASAGRCIVRVRLAGDRAWLSVKGPNTGLARMEYEYGIPVEDAAAMLDALAEKPLIEKIRHKIPLDGFVWEIDEFLGANAGLIVAEIELQSEDQQFPKPDWVGEEVTGVPRYYNSNLIQNPYRCWRKNNG